jgi:hypothetical protein
MLVGSRPATEWIERSLHAARPNDRANRHAQIVKQPDAMAIAARPATNPGSVVSRFKAVRVAQT